MKNMKQVSPIKPLAKGDSPKAFVSLFKASIAGITAAAAMLQRLVDSDPDVISKIRAIDSSIPVHVFSKLLKVANGDLRPELMLNESPAAKRAQSLPREEQDAILETGTIEVVVDAKSGRSEHVPLDKITPRQLTQVFDGRARRGKESQREVLREQAHASKPAAVAKLWEFRGNNAVAFGRACLLTVKDVKKFLRDALRAGLLTKKDIKGILDDAA